LRVQLPPVKVRLAENWTPLSVSEQVASAEGGVSAIAWLGEII
jgi:hypothetical protein